MKYTHIIWDFNGTIIDDVDAEVRSINTLLTSKGKSPISSKDEYRKDFGFPIIDYYRRIGLACDDKEYAIMAPLWVEEYIKNVKDAPLCPDVKEMLEYFKDEGYTQLIISANEINMLNWQLDGLGVREYFDEIIGLGDIEAYSKISLGVEWAKKHPDAKALFIGDTLHDHEVATAMGADCVLVSSGHQLASTLRQSGVAVVKKLTDIKTVTDQT